MGFTQEMAFYLGKTCVLPSKTCGFTKENQTFEVFTLENRWFYHDLPRFYHV